MDIVKTNLWAIFRWLSTSTTPLGARGDLQSRAINTISVQVIFSCKFQIIQSFTPKKVEKTWAVPGCSAVVWRLQLGVAGVLIDEVDSVAPLRFAFLQVFKGGRRPWVVLKDSRDFFSWLCYFPVFGDADARKTGAYIGHIFMIIAYIRRSIVPIFSIPLACNGFHENVAQVSGFSDSSSTRRSKQSLLLPTWPHS